MSSNIIWNKSGIGAMGVLVILAVFVFAGYYFFNAKKSNKVKVATPEFKKEFSEKMINDIQNQQADAMLKAVQDADPRFAPQQ